LLHFEITPGRVHENTSLIKPLNGTDAEVFEKEKYRRRNIVERLIGWLKECRRVFSRYEKTAINFRGIINIAIIQWYLKIATS
jgi:transposase